MDVLTLIKLSIRLISHVYSDFNINNIIDITKKQHRYIKLNILIY